MIPDTKEPVVIKAPSPYKFAADLAAGGVAGGVSKTAVAPIERVKLILQTQDSNPRIKSGEIPPYTGVLQHAAKTAHQKAQNQNLCSFVLFCASPICVSSFAVDLPVDVSSKHLLHHCVPAPYTAVIAALQLENLR